MAGRQLGHVVVNGEPMVALTRRDYENLDAMRRQLGGQGARLRSLREALLNAAACLAAVGDALREHRPGTPTDPGTAALFDSLPERVRHARDMAGGSGHRPARGAGAAGSRSRRP